MAYDKRYSDKETDKIALKNRQFGFFLAALIWAAFTYWDDVLMMLP